MSFSLKQAVCGCKRKTVKIVGSVPAETAVELVVDKLAEFHVELERDVVTYVTDGASVMVIFGKLVNANRHVLRSINTLSCLRFCMRKQKKSVITWKCKRLPSCKTKKLLIWNLSKSKGSSATEIISDDGLENVMVRVEEQENIEVQNIFFPVTIK